MRHFLIDTDTASDDAVALVMALRHPDVQVEAITVVAGNVPVDQGLQNALYTAELCGKQVPVYRGMAAPLVRPLETAQDVHGADGMGDIGLPLSGRTPAEGHAVDILRKTIHQFAGEITLVALGPLTNIAMALLLEPSLALEVKECIVMGGTMQGYGNVTPVAEYNIWTDPEAAKVVLSSSLPIKVVDWYISEAFSMFSPEEAQAIRDIGTPLATFCMEIQRAQIIYAREIAHSAGFVLADPIAMAVALDTSVATESKQLFVAIETDSGLCRGQTVVDHLGLMKQKPNVEAVVSASHERFLEILHAAVR